MMKRHLLLAFLIALVLLPLMSADAQTYTRYEYHSYYYNSDGDYESYDYYAYGASNGDAYYLESHTYYYRSDGQGNWSSLYVSYYYYYKDGHIWIYSYGWWVEWTVIEEFLE